MTLFIDFFWLVALILGAPFIAWKIATTPRWRVGVLERLGVRLPRPQGDRPIIWVHAVSVGEVLAARPLVRELEGAFPDHEVAISTITSTGLEVARRHFPGHLTFFYPLDLSFAVRRLLRAVKPRLIVLVELELWPTFLTLAHRAGIPIAVVNGRISERSYRRYQIVRRLMTRPISRFCVQTEEYARRFLGLGVPPSRVLITGNLKYDTPALEAGGADLAAVARGLRARLGIAEGAKVIVAGSTHPTEERTVVEALKALRAEHKDLRLVVGPRHTERIAEVLADCAAAGERCVRKTELDARAAGGAGADAGTAAAAGGGAAGGTGNGTGPGGSAGAAGGEPVVVIDTIGELARIYVIADAVFVGGSLIPHGGQNMLEPAALGKPVLFGPHVRNFRAIADDLIAAGGARMVADGAALAEALGELLRDPREAAEMGDRGRAFVERHRGAAKRTVEVLKEIIGAAGRPSRGASAEGEFRERSTSRVRA